MNSTLSDAQDITFDHTLIASYRNHADAEAAVRSLAAGGLAVETISIIGRNFETHQDVHGFYQPHAALGGAGQGAWLGGIFGLMLGAMGFFVLPVVGALWVTGPLSGMIAGAIGGAGVGAVTAGLVTSGVPHDEALKYQDRLRAGEFLVIIYSAAGETKLAHEILQSSIPTHLQAHGRSQSSAENS